MRNGGLQTFTALAYTKRKNIIKLLEKAIEIEKIEYLATHDQESMDRISDGCVVLTCLYFRDVSPGKDHLE